MSTSLTRIRHGRTITIDPKILLWRKRQRVYASLKPQVISLALEINQQDATQAKAWLSSPSTDLGGKAPRDLLNPYNIRTLYRYCRRLLRPN